MKGVLHIDVSNRKAKYSFDLKRNITVVCETAESKSKLNKWVKDYSDSNPDKKLLVIANGANRIYKKGLSVFVFLQTAGGKLTDSPWSVLFYLSLSILERLLLRAVVNQSMSSLWNTSGGLIFKTFP